MGILALLLLAALQPRLLTPDVRQFERAEIEMASPAPPSNPFDPNVARVDAEVALPSGGKLSVPAFWYQGYQRRLVNPEATGVDRVEALTPEGPAAWRIRFASRKRAAIA